MTGTWPTGWATGDMETAAEFKKGWGAIFDSTLGGSAANVDVTSISATYAHLLVVVYARGDTASPGVVVNMRFNGDTGANYDTQRVFGNAATVTATELFAATGLNTGSVPANTAGANLFGVIVMSIPHYAGSTNNKNFTCVAALKSGTTTGLMTTAASAGFWRSSAAINQVTLIPAAGNFVAGTRVTVYARGA